MMKKNKLVLSLLVLFLVLASGLTVYWFISDGTNRRPFHPPCLYDIQEKDGKKVVFQRCKVKILYGYLPNKTLVSQLPDHEANKVLERAYAADRQNNK